jgi:hypothetical protein
MKYFSFFALLITLAFSSCRFVEGRNIKGDGSVGKNQRSLSGFNGVETRGSIDIEVSPGDYKVEVESDQNILPYIVTEVENGVLVVHYKEEFRGYDVTTAKVYVTAPSLNTYKTHGSGNITATGQIKGGDKIDITVGGSGNINVNVNSAVVEVDISGSGNVEVAGETKDLSTEINGSGDIHGYNLRAETVRTSTHGSGNTEISASAKLDAQIFGSGDVNYKGAPQVSSSIHGSGAINREN